MLVLFSLSFFTLILAPSCLAEPIVEEIYVSPFQPRPLSNVIFTAGIVNNSSKIDEARLIIQECMEDLCFTDGQNISMNYSYSCCMDFFEAELELTHENATHIKYHLEILSNGSWYEYETDYVFLSVDGNENTNDSVKLTTPGFEIVILLFSIFVFLKLKKKRGFYRVRGKYR